MPDDDIYIKLLEGIRDDQQEFAKQTTEGISKLDKKMELHVQKTDYELENIHRTDEAQNEILKEHVEGVNTLKKIQETYKEKTDKRLNKIERPFVWLKDTWKLLIALGTASAAIYAAIKWLL